MSRGEIRKIAAADFKEGRWRNGMGVSWEIVGEASAGHASGFLWRFATALITADVPFSSYPGVDRVFTLIEGNGLTLSFADRMIEVGSCFAPCRFAGDQAATCRLANGPCRALNLFLARGHMTADVRILRDRGELAASHQTLAFALSGRSRIGEIELDTGDAAIADGSSAYDAHSGILYAALLAPS